jgi:hypothetical protein
MQHHVSRISKRVHEGRDLLAQLVGSDSGRLLVTLSEKILSGRSGDCMTPRLVAGFLFRPELCRARQNGCMSTLGLARCLRRWSV